MKLIKQTYKINASVDEVWQALVDPKIIEAWGAGPAEMSDKINFEFNLWGGEIFGKNIEVVKNKKLVQEWFGGKWDAPSLLTIKLEHNMYETIVELEQVNVPDAEYEDVGEGWKEYYFEPLKDYLESKTLD